MNPLSKEIQFLFKHSSIYGLGSILSKAVAFILLPLYTRALTPQDYGVLELIDVTTGMIGIVVNMGVAGAMSRFYYDFKEEKDRNHVVSTVYLIMFAISGSSVLLAVLFAKPAAAFILDSTSYQNFFIISFISLMLGILIDAGQTYLRMLYKSVLFMALSITSLVMGVSLNVLLIVYMDYGVLGALYSTLIMRLLFAIPMTAIILYRVGVGFKWSLAKEILHYSLPLIPSSLAMTLVNYSDRYFIKHYVSIADAGLYALANKLGTAVHMLITSPFIQIFLPRRFEIVNQVDAKTIFSKVYDYYFMLVLFIGLALSLFIEEIMQIMTTPEYYKAGAYVPFIVLTMFILGMKYHFEFGILYQKKTKYYSYINMFTACVHLTLNFLLVRSYGLWGAIYASMTAIALNTVLIYFVANRLYSIDFDFLRNAKMFAVAVALYALSKVHLSELFFMEVGYKFTLLTAFPLLLIWMKILSNNEVAKVKEMTSHIFQTAKV